MPSLMPPTRAANLPAAVRHSDEGAEVAGLVPVYGKTDPVAGATSAIHANNAKRILWTSMEQLFLPLLDTGTDGEEMVDGFRYAR